MKQSIKKLAIAAAMLLASVGPTFASPVNAEETAVRGQMQHWLDAYNSKDIDALLSLYSDKIYFANNGNSLKLGIEEIRRNFAPQFTDNPNTSIDFSEEYLTVGATLAHIAGKYRVSIPQDAGQTLYAYGRVLLIFEKENGQWKLIVDFDNSGNDIAATDFNRN